MKADAQVIRRILQSYKIMLEFYGMQLQSEETGLLGRALPPESCSLHYKNFLRRSSHRPKQACEATIRYHLQ